MKRKSALFRWIFILAWMGLSNVRASEPGDWRVIINIPAYTLYLYHGTEVWQSFPVAVGKPDTPSPVGDFWIVNKVADPVWFPEGRKPVPPGANNPLGRYWLGLNKKGYGIHGNNAPSSIGHSVSKGCFRMNNQDIERLFQLLPKGTSVQVIYTTVTGEIDEQKRLWLEVFPDFYQRDNLEQAINKVLIGFTGSFQPHYNALMVLLEHRTGSKVEVPRIIRVDGEWHSEASFFWNGEVYLERSCFNVDEIQSTAVEKSSLFPEHICLTTINRIFSDQCKYIWNERLNSFHIYRFKSYFNGEEVQELGKLILGMPWINVQKLAQLMGSEFYWNELNEYANIGKKQVKGLIAADCFWIAPSDAVALFPDLGVLWDEESWTFKVQQVISFQADVKPEVMERGGLRKGKKR